MAKVNVSQQEMKALQQVIREIKTDVPTGFILGGLMYKVEKAFIDEQEKNLKERYTPKKENKD